MPESDNDIVGSSGTNTSTTLLLNSSMETSEDSVKGTRFADKEEVNKKEDDDAMEFHPFALEEFEAPFEDAFVEALVFKQKTIDDGDDASENSEYSWLKMGEQHGRVWLEFSRKFRVFREICGAMVNNDLVQVVILICIMVNALIMGWQTFDLTDKMNTTLDNVDRGFLVIFTFEVALQFFYHGFSLFLDSWLLFDLGIVLLSWSYEFLQVLRGFRVLRALRIFRFFRVVTHLKPLQNLIVVIWAVMPRVLTIALMQTIALYAFAILFVELYGDIHLDYPYFTGLPFAMFTCTELITMEWASIARQLVVVKPNSWIVFMVYIIISGWVFFNLMIGVICNAVKVVDTDSSNTELEIEALNDLKQQEREVSDRLVQLNNDVADLLKAQKQVLDFLQARLGIKDQVELDACVCYKIKMITNERCPYCHAHGLALNTKPEIERAIASRKRQRRLKAISKWAGVIVNNMFLQNGIVVLIIVDSFLMGLSTSNYVTEHPEREAQIENVINIFLIIYTVEVGLQMVHNRMAFFNDGWLLFDLFIVTASWIFSSVDALDAFADLRAFRIIRACRLMTQLEMLRDIVLGVGSVFPKMLTILPLLTLFFYIFAVLFTVIFKDLPLTQNYFGDLFHSMFTCFEMMTLEWASIAREVIHVNNEWWTPMPFVAFVTLSGLVFFDFIKAVVCEAVTVVDGRALRLEETAKLKRKLAKVKQRVFEQSQQIKAIKNFDDFIKAALNSSLKASIPADEDDESCSHDSSLDPGK